MIIKCLLLFDINGWFLNAKELKQLQNLNKQQLVCGLKWWIINYL